MNELSSEEIAKSIIQSGKGKEVLNALAGYMLTEDDPADMYVLYLGIDRELDDDLSKELGKILSSFTDSYTFSGAHGFFRGSGEGTILIHIAARNAKIVYECAEALRSTYNQAGVGVVRHGAYHRVIKE